MSECLTRLPIAGPRDVSAAIYIAAIMLHFISQSKRYIPELPSFLNAMLLSGFGSLAADNDITHTAEARLLLLTFRPGCQIWQSSLVTKPAAAAGKKSKTPALATSASASTSLNFETLFPESNNHSMYNTPSFASSSLAALLSCIRQCSVLYTGLPSYNELFAPVAATLQSLLSGHQLPSSSSTSPSPIVTAVTSLSTLLTNGCTSAVRQRVPLYQKSKPMAIKQATPAFLESFTPGYDADKERAEIKKLNAKVKREKKGALRSIRGDNAVLAGERERQEEANKQEQLALRKQWRNNLEEERVIILPYPFIHIPHITYCLLLYR